MSTLNLHEGDMRSVCATFPADSFDACVTDPPYELGFMGKAWDRTGVAFDAATWAAVWRVLKPGAHLVAFGGTRTVHRITCAIEDAGFEIRDSLMWLYGCGFPKSLDVSKAIDKAAGAEREVIGTAPDRWTGKGGTLNFSTDRPQSEIKLTGSPATATAAAWQGWGTALKPAWEPIILARKPLSEKTVAANVLTHGTGGINIDASRVAAPEGVVQFTCEKKPSINALGDGLNNGKRTGEIDALTGRFPPNVLHDGSPEVLAAFAEFGDKEGHQIGILNRGKTTGKGRGFESTSGPQSVVTGYSDHGTAARFFPALGFTSDEQAMLRFFFSGKASADDRDRHSSGNNHATVKPQALMRWLVRLITPPGGHVLDPFAGSGTTGKAANEIGMHATLMELDPAHCDIIRRRPVQSGFPFEA